MSKTGSWLMEMQEAARELTLEQFIAAYGASNADVWRSVNNEHLEYDY